MRTEMNPASLTYLSLITGLLLSFLGIPMAMGKVKPNCIYGFRTEKHFPAQLSGIKQMFLLVRYSLSVAW